MNHEPVRLFDDVNAPAILRRDISAAARHRVAYDASAGAARLEASLAKGAGGAASSGWGAGALGLGALILGGLIGGGVWLTSAPEPEPPAVVAGAGRGAAPAIEAPSAAAPGEAPSIAPGEPAAIEAVEPAVPGVAIADVTPAIAAAPKDMVEEQDAPPARSARARAKRPASEAASRPAAGQTISGADYLREARGLQTARGFLGRDPAEALARAEAGAAEFPAGAFSQEWEGVAILALFELGRRVDAERRADAFLARYPKGPYAVQVREALGRE